MKEENNNDNVLTSKQFIIGQSIILFGQFILLVIALITSYYSRDTELESKEMDFEKEMESRQKELDKELILHAFSISDSLNRVKRLNDFIELDFFSPERAKTIRKKIDSGTITSKNPSNYLNLDNLVLMDTISVGAWYYEPKSQIKMFIRHIKIINGQTYGAGKIIRGDSEKDWGDWLLPNPWTNNNYGIVLIPIEGNENACIRLIQEFPE